MIMLHLYLHRTRISRKVTYAGFNKSTLISFFLIMVLTAILFWLYLNIQASVVVSAHESDIRLPESLETKIHVGNNLQVQSIGKLDTSIDINHQISVPLKGDIWLI